MTAGNDSSKPTLVAIKGTVFDVTRNEAYAPKGTYHGAPAPLFSPLPTPSPSLISRALPSLMLATVFAGKDPSRALATSSLKPEDCVPEWHDLKDENKTVLSEWFTFFSKRYNIVGKVQGATNL